uniref:Uncharacterized protein n=1 Tax=Arundo donax TaxID=35708 RepID=A0A0A9FQ07_ARUDO
MSVPSLHHIHSIAFLGFLGDRSGSMHLPTTRCRASFPELVAVQHAMPMQVQSSTMLHILLRRKLVVVEACGTLIDRIATHYILCC